MAATELPIPAELLDEAPPITDADLDRLFDAADALAHDAAIDYAEAVRMVREEHPTAGWMIGGDNEAEWAGRKLAEALAEVGRYQQQAAAWAEKISRWLDEVTRKPMRTAMFMDEKLQDYAIGLRAFGGPATLNLPSVVVKTTEQQPKAEVVDNDALAAFLEQAFEFAFEVAGGTDMIETDRWKAWAAAIEDQGVELVDVVRREAKVYVNPFRKLVSIKREEVDVWDVTVHLSCGHSYSWTTSDDNPETPERGESKDCGACIERVAVTHSTIGRQVRSFVAGPDGKELPGVEVKPGSVKATVTPR